MLIQGNFTRLQASEVAQIVANNFRVTESINFKKSLPVFAKQLPVGVEYFKVRSMLIKDKNSIVKNYYQIGEESLESECLIEILTKVIREPLFNTLRTQEQLGYSVSCSSKKEDNFLGFIITVESQERKNPSWLVDGRIERFLKEFSKTFESMEEEEFEIIKQSIIAQKRSADIDLECEVIRNWIEIRDGKYKFNRNELEIMQMELITKSDVITFFIDHLITPERVRKLSIQVIANAECDNSMLEHGYVHLNVLK